MTAEEIHSEDIQRANDIVMQKAQEYGPNSPLAMHDLALTQARMERRLRELQPVEQAV